MARQIAVDDEVQALLGPAMVNDIRRRAERESVYCSYCSSDAPAPAPLSLVVAIHPGAPRERLVLLTHATCTPSEVRRIAPDQPPPQQLVGGRTQVQLLLRILGRPVAILAWEEEPVIGQVGDDVVDLRVASALERGLQPVLPPVTECKEVAEGWVLVLAHDRLAVRDATGQWAIPTLDLPHQERQDAPSWHEVARGTGQCLLLTGSGLRLDSDDAVFAALEAAAAAGQLAGGVVPVLGAD